MRALLTGATGFTGSFVLPRLAKQAGAVRCLVRNPLAADALRAAGCEVVVGDFEDSAALERAMRGCDTLVNVASLGFGHAPAIVRAAETAGVGRAVFVSTTAIFTGLNAPSKKARVEAEDCIRHSKLRWTILRPTMIYGSERDRNICRLIRAVRRWPVLPVVGPGTFLMQPVLVDDLAEAIVRAATSEMAIAREYNVSGRAPLSYNELVQTVAEEAHERIRLFHLPVAPMVRMLRAGETLGLRLPIKAEQVERLNENKAFDWGSAARDFEFAPRDFRSGVRLEIQRMDAPATHA